MIDLIFGIGLNVTDPGAELHYEEPAALHLKVKHEDYPVYAWGSFGRGEYFVLGQGTAKTQALSAGLGLTHDLTPKVSVFAEAGVTFNKLDNDLVIQQEVAFTYLVDRHHVPTRPIPVQTGADYDQDTYETTFEVNNPVVAKLGVNFDISNRWSTSVAYRWSKTDTLIEIYDFGAKEAGLGWWMEEASTDTSAIEVQLLFRW